MLFDKYSLSMVEALASDSSGNHFAPATFEMFHRDDEVITVCGVELFLQWREETKNKIIACKAGEENEFSSLCREFPNAMDLFGESDFTINYRSKNEIVGPNEPMVSIKTNLADGLLSEGALLHFVNTCSAVATRAKKMIVAAKGIPLVEFGLRRSFNPDLTSYAACQAGFAGTSNMSAASKYNLDSFGTMAHAYIMAHKTELDAFRNFSRVFPESTALLIDTYSLESGLNNAIVVAREMEEAGLKLKAVRIDSGTVHDAMMVRRVLDDNNLEYVKIIASDNFDTSKIMLYRNVVDMFGVGTNAVSVQKPLSGVFKLTSINNEPVMKKSGSDKTKASWPGYKKVEQVVEPARCISFVSLEEEINPEFSDKEDNIMWSGMDFDGRLFERRVSKQLYNLRQTLIKEHVL